MNLTFLLTLLRLSYLDSQLKTFIADFIAYRMTGREDKIGERGILYVDRSAPGIERLAVELPQQGRRVRHICDLATGQLATLDLQGQRYHQTSYEGELTLTWINQGAAPQREELPALSPEENLCIYRFPNAPELGCLLAIGNSSLLEGGYGTVELRDTRNWRQGISLWQHRALPSELHDVFDVPTGWTRE
jgi:hypothetical protein